MAVTAPDIHLAFYQNEGSADISLRHAKEGASQTFVKGEPVAMYAGFLIEHVPATDTDSTGTPLGLAWQNGNNTTAGAYRIAYQPFTDDTILIGNLKSASDVTLVYDDATHRGAGVGLQQDGTTGRWEFNADATGVDASEYTFRVLDVHRNYTDGDSNVWVLCKPIIKNATFGGNLTVSTIA